MLAHAADNFYCIYKRRHPGELLYQGKNEGVYLTGAVPDCDGWKQTLTQHARQLTAAGVDHVVVDMVCFPGCTTP